MQEDQQTEHDKGDAHDIPGGLEAAEEAGLVLHDLDAVRVGGGVERAGGEVGAGAGLGHQEEGQTEVQEGKGELHQALARHLELPK